MRRIKATIAAVLIALTTWYYALVRPPDATEPEDDAINDDEIAQPISPAYEVASVYDGLTHTLEERKQADIMAVRQAAKQRMAYAERVSLQVELDRRKRINARLDAKPKQQDVSRGNKPQAVAQTYEATFYTAFCPSGCIGITATGLDVSKSIYTPSGHRIIAVDPAQIPLGSLVELTFADGTSFRAVAEDTGGAIKGRRIDVLVTTRDEAYRLGRQSVEVRIIRRGR